MDASKIANLQSPYHTHSEVLRATIKRDMDRVFFYDHSVADRRDGAWVVAATRGDGNAGDAGVFVAAQHHP